jgi:hypothetical protein
MFPLSGKSRDQSMIKCAAVRRKGCDDPCTLNAIKGHSLCGRHARAKNVRIWKHPDQPGIVKIQAHIRGWLVRLRLKRAGPGVLCRKNLANDEDLVTYEERVHPFEYFSFEENGKVWWFRFETLWLWAARTLDPVNPYTKVPLSQETRKRLRATWGHRKWQKIPVGFPKEDRLRANWNIVCQALHDNGFAELRPESFMNLSKNQLVVAVRMMYDDLQVSLPRTDRSMCMISCLLLRGIQSAYHMKSQQYAVHISYIFMLAMCLPKDPYIYAFTLLSALYRC